MVGYESLLRAAISAACRERAPRRTIAAIAAAVTTSLVTAAVTQAKDTSVPPGHLVMQGVRMDVDAHSGDELAKKLCEARAAKRRLKRQKKREADKAAKAETLEVTEPTPMATTWEEPTPMATTWEESAASLANAAPSTWAEVLAAQSSSAELGKRIGRGDKDAANSVTSMSTDTPDMGKRRPVPVVDPEFLRQLRARSSSDVTMQRPSSPAAAAAPERTAGSARRGLPHTQPARARRGPS